MSDDGGFIAPGEVADLAPGSTVVVPETICRWCRGPLSGKETAFCSKACNGRWYDAQHPRINRAPSGPRQGTIKALILGLLSEGEWWTKRQIADAIHAFEHSVGTRISELQRGGHAIETDARNPEQRAASHRADRNP